jgi:hypothetical protein
VLIRLADDAQNRVLIQRRSFRDCDLNTVHAGGNIAGFVPAPFWHDLAVFGPFIEILGHRRKGKFARKHRIHDKSGVALPEDQLEQGLAAPLTSRQARL